MRRNKQAMPWPAARDGCILNGPLQHKQEARSLIGGLWGTAATWQALCPVGLPARSSPGSLLFFSHMI